MRSFAKISFWQFFMKIFSELLRIELLRIQNKRRLNKYYKMRVNLSLLEGGESK